MPSALSGKHFQESPALHPIQRCVGQPVLPVGSRNGVWRRLVHDDRTRARQQLETQTKIVRAGDGVQRDGNPGSNPVANGDPTLPPTATRTPTFKIGSIDTDVAMRRKRKEYERATRESEKQLTEIAEETGGRMFLPANANELLAQADSIARDIGSQYIVTYRPTRPLSSAKPGEYRKVEVASRRVGLYLRSRHGYVVPNN